MENAVCFVGCRGERLWKMPFALLAVFMRKKLIDLW
jgi:hypothetical protein